MHGYFEQFANRIVWQESALDRQDVAKISQIVQTLLRGQTHWAGSQRKSTAIVGSDLDLCINTTSPVTKSQRLELANQLTHGLERSARPHAHIIRIAPRVDSVKIDIAFANAEFGNRPLPDTEEFKDPRRQQVARLLKTWLRSPGMPHVSGWAIESLVVALDNRENTAELLFKIMHWLKGPRTPNDIESILKPRAKPMWNPNWSSGLSGTLQAISNNATNRLNHKPPTFRSADDVKRWLLSK